MLNLLQRGRLEVETDLLLGAEQVLLRPQADAVLGAPRLAVACVDADVPGPAAVAPAAPQPSDPVQRNVPSRGFDAALFATGVGAAPAKHPERPLADRATDDTRTVAAAPAVVTTRPEPTQARISPVGGEATRTPTPITPLVDRVRPPEGTDNAARLHGLERLHARGCPHCTTATAHTHLVFGEGNPHAELVFVGEAPGETEDRLGRPFVGRAGEKLDEMIAAMGLRREDVYIANVLKSRPPDNRTPLAHEIDACGPYLLAQLAVIRPKAIVTLGGPASKLLLASELGITRLRGIPATVRLGVADGQPFDVPVMPTFHPAYLLRNYTVETRQQVWEDLKKVLGLLGRTVPVKASAHSGATQPAR